MITIHGTVTLASAPLVTTASDGTFVLSALAHDHIGIGGKTPWRLTWCGDHAHAFYAQHAHALQPDALVHVEGTRVWGFGDASKGRYGATELRAMVLHMAIAQAVSLELAPFAYETARQPMRNKREQLCNVEQAAYPLNLFPSSSTTPTEISP